MSTALPLSTQPVRQSAPASVHQSSNVKRHGNVDDHDPPVYAHLCNPLRVRLRAFINTRKGFLSTVAVWIIVDLSVESSDIAQIAQAMQQAPGTQGSSQNGISAWALFSHSCKIIALVVYLYIEARRPPSVVPAMNQRTHGSNLANFSQRTGPDLSGFVQSAELELGRYEMDSVRAYHFPTPYLRLKSHHASASCTASHLPVQQAYAQASRASSSKDPLRAADNNFASSTPPEQYEMQTFHGHAQLPEEPTRPPPVLIRQHRLRAQSSVTRHESTLRGLPAEKHGQARRSNALDHGITPPESPLPSPRELPAISKHLNNQAVPDLSPHAYPGTTALPNRPSSASVDAEGPPGPVLIRQV